MVSFQECLQFPSDQIPPTIVCKSFDGLFELFKKLELNFKELLHTAQSFEFLKALELNEELVSETSLVKFRSRGPMHFLFFESELWSQTHNCLAIQCQSQILISSRKETPQ